MNIFFLDFDVKTCDVRDHIFGRKNGFVLGVFPEIIRHPANCQIITHSDNIKKSLKNGDSDIKLLIGGEIISNNHYVKN